MIKVTFQLQKHDIYTTFAIIIFSASILPNDYVYDSLPVTKHLLVWLHTRYAKAQILANTLAGNELYTILALVILFCSLNYHSKMA
jgi:hypothetical protein